MSTLERVIIPIPVITDFHVIKDQSFAIQIGGDLDAEKDFTLKPFPARERLWLLAWNVCTETEGTVEYEARINERLVTTWSFQGRAWHLVQEALGAAVIQDGLNKITFRALSSGVRLSIGDLTLLFRDALAISRVRPPRS